MKPSLGSPIEVFTRMMFTQIITRLAAFLSENRFSVSEIAALHIVGREGSISVKALGERLNLSISATSRLVSGLVEKDLFIVKASKEDARSKIVSCSKEGERLLDRLSLERVSAIFDIIPTLPPEIPKKMFSAISIFGGKKNGN